MEEGDIKMIDEKKLIERLHKCVDTSDNSNFTNGMLSAIDVVNQQPKIGEWIPCSEKMPDVPNGIKDDDCPEFNVTIEGAVESTTLRCASDGTWFDDSGFVYTVVAWQPLPEAYQLEQKRDKV